MFPARPRTLADRQREAMGTRLAGSVPPDDRFRCGDSRDFEYRSARIQTVSGIGSDAQALPLYPGQSADNPIFGLRWRSNVLG